MSDGYTEPYQRDPYDPYKNDPQQNRERTVPMPPLTNEEMRLDETKLTPPQGASGGNPPPSSQRRRAILIAIIASVLVLALIIVGIIKFSGNHHPVSNACAPCSATATSVATGVATTIPATIAPTTAAGQPTAVAITTCASSAGFAQASAATTGSTNFLAVTFPPNTVAPPSVTGESNNFQTRRLLLCTPGITSTADLQTTIRTAFGKVGWQPATPPASSTQICGNTGCWSQADTSTKPATMQYISLDAITITGGVATYAMRLTIAPIFNETVVTMNNGATLSFEQTTHAELQWDTTLHAIASNNVIGVQLPANSYATTTYAMISQQIANFGHLPNIAIIAGTTCALQGTGGFYIKFAIQEVTSGQITLNYVVYPYGF